MNGFMMVVRLKTDLEVGVPGEQPEPVEVGGGGHPVEQPGAPPPPGDGVHRELLEVSIGEDEAEDQLPVLHQVDQHVEGAVQSRQKAGEVAHNF